MTERKLTEKGDKARQQTDELERWIEALVINEYRENRRNVGDACYVSDIDQVEWRVIDQKMIPIAILELTVRQPRDFPMPDKYFAGITNRYYNTDGQGKFCQTLGFRLECPVYVVILQQDRSEYWTHEIDYQASRVFTKRTPGEYTHWIRTELEENYRRKHEKPADPKNQ
jgi:hypothetical protein